MSKQHLKITSHLLGGILTILLAFRYYENRSFELMKLYIAAGCLFIVIGALSNLVGRFTNQLSPILFVAQAVLFFYAGTLRQEDEDMIITIIVVLAGSLYLGLVVYFMLNRDPSVRRRRSRKRASRAPVHPRQVN